MKSIRFASILMAAGFLTASPIYTVIDLGSLGGSSAQAFSLNDNGLSVGSATTPFGYSHAFSSSGSGMTDMTVNSPASQGMAAGVNNSGQIAGTQYIGGEAYATEWTNGSAQLIGTAGSYGMAIDNSGQIAGMDSQGHAFVTIDGVPFDMGAISGGDWSSAYAINNSGEVAGYGQTSSGAFRGFVWSQGAGYGLLGTFGGANSYAMALNDQGQAAGSAQTSGGFMNAFLWTNGFMQDLGTLGGTSSYAYGVNGAGQVVGYSYVDGSTAPHAFLFENGVMFDLNSLIDASSGWVLTEAYAINASGEIAGAGLLDGVEHAFLLDPEATTQIATAQAAPGVPEPGTRMMFAIGVAAIVSSRFLPRLRRRRRGLRRERSRSDAAPQ